MNRRERCSVSLFAALTLERGGGSSLGTRGWGEGGTGAVPKPWVEGDEGRLSWLLLIHSLFTFGSALSPGGGGEAGLLDASKCFCLLFFFFV